jgi:hypothetical protein
MTIKELQLFIDRIEHKLNECKERYMNTSDNKYKIKYEALITEYETLLSINMFEKTEEFQTIASKIKWEHLAL